jgi:hypothetical protein
MLAKAILAIAPYISEVLSPIARNIGHKLGEAFGNNSQEVPRYPDSISQ